jgi:hypothetical protein
MIDETIICQKCGEEFQIHHFTQRTKKYCSYKCSSKQYRDNVYEGISRIEKLTE